MHSLQKKVKNETLLAAAFTPEPVKILNKIK